jgi:hypothetical protein
VSNNSWGSSSYSQGLYDAIAASQRVGHIFVASAGNEGKNTDDSPHYPASYDLPNIISVAATDNDDNLAIFPSCAMSNFGATSVDLAAPGLYIYSTGMSAVPYLWKSGTSMAAPHVTGTVALVLSRSPTLSWQQARDLILMTARPVPALDGITVTGGVVNARDALVDCNLNGVPDAQDIAYGTSEDCTGDGVPDECEPDCNENGVADSCDLAEGTSIDCNDNAVPDLCDLACGGSQDCNANDVPDDCDTAVGTSEDCDHNSVPDECEPDCNGNNVTDACDILQGTSLDCNENGVPDDCIWLEVDCNENLVPDSCDISAGTSQDNDANDIPDECQTVRRVPLMYPTVQAAVDAAVAGDTVLVAEGEYFENIGVIDKTVLVIQGAGPGRTIINGDQSGSVVFFQDAVDVVLDGFTLTNGLGSEDSYERARGGGVSAFGSSVGAIRNCVISDNVLAAGLHNYGGGIHWSGGSLTLVNSEIVSNRTFGVNGYGVGVYLNSVDVVMQNCRITENEGLSSGNNTGGGIMFVSSCTGLARNTTIARNVASEGAGVKAGTDPPLTDPHLQNCIIYGNTGASGVQIAGTEIWVESSDIEGGWPGEGNIDADPLFVDPDQGDYRLQRGSPCIDAGGNEYVLADLFDLDHDGDSEEPFPFDLGAGPRFVDDPETVDTGSGIPPVVDMGAYEYPAGVPIPTTSQWGVILMAVLLVGAGAGAFARRRPRGA